MTKGVAKFILVVSLLLLWPAVNGVRLYRQCDELTRRTKEVRECLTTGYEYLNQAADAAGDDARQPYIAQLGAALADAQFLYEDASERHRLALSFYESHSLIIGGDWFSDRLAFQRRNLDVYKDRYKRLRACFSYLLK